MNKLERLMIKLRRQKEELNETFEKMEQEYKLIIDSSGTEETLKRVAFNPKETDKQRFVKHVIGNDLHAPDHNPQAVNLFEQFITDIRPDVLHINGDLCNFTTVSKYLVVDYRKTLNEELDIARGVFYHIVDTARRANPNVEIYFEYGNHEARLAKFLWKDADALTDLADIKGDPILTVEHLFNLKENKINYIPYGQGYRQENFIVTHGEKLGVKSGYAPHKNIEVYSSDGATGHSHKEAIVTRNMGDRVIVWGEYGCLCNLHPNPAYVVNPDWTNGFGYVVYDKKSKLTHPTPIIIRNDQFYFGGKLYESNVQK